MRFALIPEDPEPILAVGCDKVITRPQRGWE